jgi:ribosomal protein S18 acetylase RimI-like enzyme
VSDVEIRPPDPDEVEAVAEMWVALAADQRAHRSHLLAAENREVVRRSLARQVIADGVRVAERDGSLVGFVTFAPETGDYQTDVDRGVVHNLYVCPDVRGDGVGTDLLAVAERALAERGAEVVALEAMAANDRARRFYERHGYAPTRVEFEKRVESDTRRG